MLARRSLAEVEAAKQVLRRRIALRRQGNAALAARVLRPLATLELLWNLCRDIGPFFRSSFGGDRDAAAPRSPWLRIWRALWRWAPAIASIMRDLRRVRAA